MNHENDITKSEANRLLSSSAVKLIMSVSEENIKIDLFNFVTAAARVRKLQKKYFFCKSASEKKEILLKCKQAEYRLDEIGNTLWKKYRFDSWENGFSTHTV